MLPPVREVVGLRGAGVLHATPESARDALPLLRVAGYTVVTIDGSLAHTGREALAAIASALDLPGAADHNLDALLDTLRELSDRDDLGGGVVLVWTRADRIRVRDPRGWRAVRAVLADASDELRSWGFAFETIACVPDDVPQEDRR